MKICGSILTKIDSVDYSAAGLMSTHIMFFGRNKIKKITPEKITFPHHKWGLPGLRLHGFVNLMYFLVKQGWKNVLFGYLVWPGKLNFLLQEYFFTNDKQ